MLRRASFLFAALFLVYGAVLAACSHQGFPLTRTTQTFWPWLGDKPVGEDGFYMLTVARHIATDHRIAYNYGAPVTGIQPLVTFLWAAVAVVNLHLGGSAWTLVRAVLLLECALFVLLAFLVATLAARLAPEPQREVVFFLAFVLVLFDFAAFRLCTYGLETGPYLVLFALCVLLWQRLVQLPGPRRWPWVVLLGLAAGLAGLARIDFGLVFAVVLLVGLLRRQITVAQAAACGAVALVGVAPWFAYVHSLTRGLLPSSGRAEGRLISFATLWPRAQVAGTSLLVHLVPWSFASSSGKLVDLAQLCLLALFVWAVWGRRRILPALQRPAIWAVLLPWLLGFALLLVVYPVFFWVVWFYPRYFAPGLLLWVPLLALALATQPALARRPLAWALVPLLFFCVEVRMSLDTGRIATNHIISAGYIQHYFPRARVGAFQSGVLGYFDPNVINLDGKMNDAALHAGQQGTLPAYLDRSGITVLVDWESMLRGHLPAAYLAAKWQPCPQPMPVPDSICLVRRAP